jgi:hypothetical protein
MAKRNWVEATADLHMRNGDVVQWSLDPMPLDEGETKVPGWVEDFYLWDDVRPMLAGVRYKSNMFWDDNTNEKPVFTYDALLDGATLTVDGVARPTIVRRADISYVSLRFEVVEKDY